MGRFLSNIPPEESASHRVEASRRSHQALFGLKRVSQD
jgi:hypothetical protein